MSSMRNFYNQLRYSLWGFAILLEIITPISSKKILLKQEAQVSSIHLPERFGLFTLIVIGETIANLTRGITLNAFTLYSASIVVVGLLITFAIWWIYYDERNIMPTRKEFHLSMLWEYAHLPLMLGITILSVCIQHIFTRYTQYLLKELTILCISFAVILGSMATLSLASYLSQHTFNKHYSLMLLFRFTTVIISLVLLAFIPLLSPLIIMGILAILSIGQIIDNIVLSGNF